MQIFSRPGHVIRSGPGRDAVARGDAIADGLTTEQAARANGVQGCHAAIRATHKLRA